MDLKQFTKDRRPTADMVCDCSLDEGERFADHLVAVLKKECAERDLCAVSAMTIAMSAGLAVFFDKQLKAGETITPAMIKETVDLAIHHMIHHTNVFEDTKPQRK